jgi:hypothetical protein
MWSWQHVLAFARTQIFEVGWLWLVKGCVYLLAAYVVLAACAGICTHTDL